MKVKGFVIKDFRDNKIYFDDQSFIRINFEKMLNRNITLEKAKEKYPDIIDCRK